MSWPNSGLLLNRKPKLISSFLNLSLGSSIGLCCLSLRGFVSSNHQEETKCARIEGRALLNRCLFLSSLMDTDCHRPPVTTLFPLSSTPCALPPPQPPPLTSY